MKQKETQMSDTSFYKIYQLLSFFVLKFSYKTLNLPNAREDELWLINRNHEFYPLIRLTTNSIEQVMFEKERIDGVISLVFKQLKINRGRFLDVHITKDEVLSTEIYDSVALEDHYYSGLALNDIYPGIGNVVHNVENGNLEIQEISNEIATYMKQARAQKRNLKVNLPIVTSVSIIISAFFFLITFLLSKSYGQINTLVALGANYQMFTVGLDQFWRLLISGFLHANIFHLLMNMMALYNLGTAMEKEIGSAKFALVLYGSVLAGSLFSLTFHENTISVGMSGGLYGLLGVYIMTAYKHGDLRNPAITRTIFINLLINFVNGVDFYAHIGGLVAGIMFYYILNNRKEMYAIYLIFVMILSFKSFTIKEIYPKYGGTDFAVTEIYRNMGLTGYADKLDAKLYEVYQER